METMNNVKVKYWTLTEQTEGVAALSWALTMPRTAKATMATRRLNIVIDAQNEDQCFKLKLFAAQSRANQKGIWKKKWSSWPALEK